MHFVFIYGTLKRGFQNAVLRPQDARFAGVFRTVAPYPLFIAGKWFSPCLANNPGQGVRVSGELFAVGHEGLGKLDLLEGTGFPGGYRRVAIQVQKVEDDLVREAHAYVKSRAEVGPIHDGPLAAYPNDARYVLPANRNSAFG